MSIFVGGYEDIVFHHLRAGVVQGLNRHREQELHSDTYRDVRKVAWFNDESVKKDLEAEIATLGGRNSCRIFALPFCLRLLRFANDEAFEVWFFCCGCLFGWAGCGASCLVLDLCFLSVLFSVIHITCGCAVGRCFASSSVKLEPTLHAPRPVLSRFVQPKRRPLEHK